MVVRFSRTPALVLALILAGALFCPHSSAETIHFYSGPDTSPDGLTLSDFSVRAIGPDTPYSYTVSFVLSNSLEDRRVTFTERGIFVAATDPAGDRRYFEFSYPGETLSPGASLMYVETLTLGQAGEWRIWPSYEVLIAGSDSMYGDTRMGPEEWHFYTLTAREGAPDLTPLSLHLSPRSLVIWRDTILTLTIKNVGGTHSGECLGAVLVESTLDSFFTIPEMAPGETVTLTVPWVPSQLGVQGLTVYLDYWDAVREGDETNNVIEARAEAKSPDLPPLEILSGPRVIDVTQTSAALTWETSGTCSSTVVYGDTARIYSSVETDLTPKHVHVIRLTGLKPSTTYHYQVTSVDEYGNTVTSRGKTFQTLTPPGEEPPNMQIRELGVLREITTINADTRGDAGVEKVEFHINGVLVFTDYSYPYSFTFDPSLYDNGIHRLTSILHDLQGNTIAQSKDVEFLNIKDASAPTAKITFPKKDDKVSGKIHIKASLADDTGLGQVFFKVDGGFESFKGYPDNPKSSEVVFTLDTGTVGEGIRRLSVEVYDKDGKYGYDTVDVWVTHPQIPSPPTLKVKNHVVTRHDNYFVVSLSVENVGGATATNVVIQDFLRSFQPISGEDSLANYIAGFTSSTMIGDMAILSKTPIPPKQTRTYTFQAVPVLVHPETDYPTLTPCIGDPVRVWYEDLVGKDYYEESNAPVPATTNGETIPISYNKAIKSADYLMVTNPQRLGFYSPSKDVSELLSAMAKLARYRLGVLGYSTYKYSGHEQELQGLIKDGGPWNSKLSASYSSSGFLLLVGETEIIPSWSRVIGTFYTTQGDYTWKVVTDNPYANTYGDEKRPELSISRIIGSNAKELRKVIETNLNVLLKEQGYGFDRSKALLVSGFPSNLMGGFDAQVDAVADTIKKKTPSTQVDKIHTPDYTQYSPSTGKMNVDYTNAAVDSVFFGVVDGRSVIFLAGHGNWDHWDMIERNDVYAQTDPFGWSSPFIFASSCKTGTYVGVTGISEAFLQKGAAAYLGATESGGWTQYSTKFFELWGLDVPVSQAVKQLKAGLGDAAMDKIWLNIYHVYGDAKFGAVPSTLQTVVFSTPSTGAEIPTRVEVVVPDYVITETDGEHRITVPGGYELHEAGLPIVPSFNLIYDYPKGCQIQDVSLEYRSTPQTIHGINIPNAIIELPFNDVQTPAPQYTATGWWPESDYKWSVSQGPEGATLIITVYPLQYDPETSTARFHKLYWFTVDYTVPGVDIKSLTTDKPVYPAGEPVTLNTIIENRGSDEVDAVLEAYIVDESTGDLVDGLELRTLRGLRGEASYSIKWGSDGFMPGAYSLVVRLLDSEGLLMDTSSTGFTLGTISMEVTLGAESSRPQTAEKVVLQAVLRNTGDQSLTADLVINIYDVEGVKTVEFSREIPAIEPAQTRQVSIEWDTSSAPEGIYRVVAYALYMGGSSVPSSILVGVDDEPPEITPVNPSPGLPVKNLVNLQAIATDQSEVVQVTLSIKVRLPGQESVVEGLESMPATHQFGSLWQLPFNTAQVLDGSYLLTITAVDAFGNIAEETVEFTVCNTPSLNILAQVPGAMLMINEEKHLIDDSLSVTAQGFDFTLIAQPILETSEGSRALFVEWEDGTQSNTRTVTVSQDTTLMARYVTQHRLTVTSPHGDPIGDGWYEEGTEAIFSVESPTGLIPQHVFTAWSGDYEGSSPTSSITMDGPKTVTATWGTRYTNLYYVICLAIITVIAILLVRAREVADFLRVPS